MNIVGILTKVFGGVDFEICRYLFSQLEKCQTFTIKIFAEIVNGFKPLAIFAKYLRESVQEWAK